VLSRLLIFSEQDGAHENTGSETLDEHRGHPVVCLSLQVRERTLIVDLSFSVQVPQRLEENIHANEASKDLSHDHVHSLESERHESAWLFCQRATDPVDVHGDCNCWVVMGTRDRTS